MSKISPMQAAALGIKTNPTKPAAEKVVATKAAAVKPATAKTSINPVATKIAPKKTVVNTVSVKPAVTKTVAKPSPKPALKVASKPKADHTKKDKKNDHKKDDKKAKPEKAKVEKVKMERDSFTMPKDEYAQLTLLKVRLTSMGQPAKKSELLRAGIKLLAAMSDNTLKTTLAKIPVIKTGRPNK